MAKLDPNPYPLPEIDFRNLSLDQPHDAEFQRLMEISDNLPETELKGTIVHTPVADGAAYYIVTKLRPFTVQWIPYSDAWHASNTWIRGLNLDDIRDEKRRRAALKKLIANRR